MLLKNKLYLYAFFFAATYIAYLNYNKPKYNWDILPYMYLVLDSSKDDQSSCEVKSDVYEIIKSQIPHAKYEDLVSGNTFKENAFVNCDVFVNALKNHRLKPMYNVSTYLFFKCGSSLTNSTILPNVLAYLSLVFCVINVGVS